MRPIHFFRTDVHGHERGSWLRTGLLVTVIAASSVVRADTYTWPYNPGSDSSTIQYNPSNSSAINFSQIETGLCHTVALSDGKVYTWGSSNAQNQLGRGGDLGAVTAITSFQDKYGHGIATPTIIKVAASNNAGFAVDNHNNLYYWGTIDGSPVKSKPTMLDYCKGKVYDIVAAGEHGLISGGWESYRGLYSFGSNEDGESALWPCIDRWSLWLPANITHTVSGHGSITVADMAVGAHHSVVLLPDGRVRVFGRNTSGQLGVGDMNPITGAPLHTLVATAKTAGGSYLTGVSQVAAGNDFSLVRMSDGTVRSAGGNGAGELGRTGDPTLFAQVDTVAGATNIAAGYNFSFAQTAGGLYQWGFVVTSNSAGGVVTPSLVPGVVSAETLSAGNGPVPTTGPWDTTFLTNGGASHSVSNATIATAPVYLRTELYNDPIVEGERAGQGYIGGASGWVRVYATAPAVAGNGPTFTCTTSDTNFGFGAGVKVPDGSDHVDIPIWTIPVSAEDVSTFNVEQTGGPTITGKKLTVHVPAVTDLTATNATNPGMKAKGGNTIHVSFTLLYPAPAEGYTVPITSSIPGAFPSTGISVPGGATSAEADFTLGTVEANDTVTLQAENKGYVNAFARFDIAIAELVKILRDPTEVFGGADTTATILLDSAPPTAGLSVEVTTSDTGIAFFDTTPITLTSMSTSVPVHTVPVATDKVVNLKARDSGVLVRVPLTVKGPNLISATTSNSHVRGGNPTTITGTFGSELPASGVTVTLSSSNPSVANFQVASYNATTGSFTLDVDTFHVAALTDVTLTLTVNGRSKNVVIHVRP